MEKQKQVAENTLVKTQLAKLSPENVAVMKLNKKQALDQALEVKKEQTEKKKTKKVKVVALSNLSGKYLLPYSEGDKFLISEVQAKELVENKDAELIK